VNEDQEISVGPEAVALEDQAAVSYSPVAEEAREFWRNSARQIVRESISAIEESAGHAATINGVLIGFYVNAVALTQKRIQASALWQIVLFISPVCFWLLSMGAALGVFWIRNYTLNIQSSTGAKEIIETIARKKHNRLRISFILLFGGILSLLFVILAYVGL
jgi:H+/Cl- antiporter ClcA